MRRWIEPPNIPYSEALLQAVGGSELLAKTLVRRGYRTPQEALAFLDPEYYQPALPSELPGLHQAAERLLHAIQEGEVISVWGDFDVDGQTATTLLVSGLSDLGAKVNYYIPVRAHQSHGIHLPKLVEMIQEGQQVLLTCDTGISAHEAVEYAKSRGVDVIITDHHDLPESLPEALAIVNPKLLAPYHPLYTLPGVGVAFKLIETLYQKAGRPEDCLDFLDLVALGIVSDVALLQGDTRYLLQRGLAVLRQTKRLGLQILMELAEVNPAGISEEHIGFVLGPRLNALGRLADANSVVELLTTQDSTRARILAMELEGLNDQRKLLTEQIYQSALHLLDQEPSLAEKPALVLAHPRWPGGILGIVANRLATRLGKPAVLITAPPGEIARGSARSIEGVNITTAITTQAERLLGYGGHPMAAGFSLQPEEIPAFREGLAKAIAEQMGSERPEITLVIDSDLPLGKLTLELVAEIERLAPFGPGNPPLVLAARNVHIASHRSIGKNEEHLRLNVQDDDDYTQEVIFWHGRGEPLPEAHFDLAYTVHSSNYLGKPTLQVTWVAARLPEVPFEIIQVAPLQFEDFRQAAYPAAILSQIRQQNQYPEEFLIWAEGAAKEKTNGSDRLALRPAKILVIWTSPPSRQTLTQALEQVSPQKVYLFADTPETEKVLAFVARLAGLAKFALNHRDGRINLEQLAAATAQEIPIVRLGIHWLHQRGWARVITEQGNDLTLGPGDQQPQPGLASLQAQIQQMLAETAAYRAYYRRTDPENLR